MGNVTEAQLNNLDRVLGESYKKWSTDAVTAKTKVLLSFGSREDGIYYAFNLLKGIMEKAGITDKYEVYVDAQSNIEHPSTLFEDRHGVTIPLNPLWEQLYENAVKHCKCMVFICTEEWAKSQYCLKEYSWWLQHAAKTPIVTMVFTDAIGKLGASPILASGASKLTGRNRMIQVHKSSKPVVPDNCQPELDELMGYLREFGAV